MSSSSSVRHDSADVTRQIPFEINPAFFPPPTISLPPDDVTPPGNFDYNFEHEYDAISRYKEEQESIITSDGSTPRPTAIDIISKLSYLPISGSSKPKVQQQPVIQPPPPEQPSIPATPSRESPIVPVSTSTSTSYAAGLLPTWTPPQLSLDGLFR